MPGVTTNTRATLDLRMALRPAGLTPTAPRRQVVPKGRSELCSSVSSPSRKHRRDGAKQYLQVFPEGLAFDVNNIQPNLAGKVDFAAAANLPDAGNARPGSESTTIRQRIPGNFAWHRRSRSNQRHVPNEHVVELRQFIEGESSQPLAHARNPGVILELEGNALFVLVLVQQILQ